MERIALPSVNQAAATRVEHNPGVADLVDLLAAASATGRIAIGKFPTAAIAVMSVAGPWSALRPACAILESFWAPRQQR